MMLDLDMLSVRNQLLNNQMSSVISAFFIHWVRNVSSAQTETVKRNIQVGKEVSFGALPSIYCMFMHLGMLKKTCKCNGKRFSD